MAQAVVSDLSEKVELMSSQIQESQAACAVSDLFHTVDGTNACEQIPSPFAADQRYVNAVQREEVLKEQVSRCRAWLTRFPVTSTVAPRWRFEEKLQAGWRNVRWISPAVLVSPRKKQQ